MQAKTVGRQTRNRDLVIPGRPSRSTLLCGLCALCGEFFLRLSRRSCTLVLQPKPDRTIAFKGARLYVIGRSKMEIPVYSASARQDIAFLKGW